MDAFAQTIKYQTDAANPSISAWVAANAGSGKTRVLTNRVARLLLEGADPSHILCITYTKAAAAEMAERLFSLLGGWALKDNETLAKKLQELEGEGARPRTGEQLSKARQLFARALETPGGLKIQTIHAFCASVLRRFPVEANIPPGFKELDDGATALLIDTAIRSAIRDTQNNSALRQSFDHLAALYGANSFSEKVKRFISERFKIDACIEFYGSADGMIKGMEQEFSLKPEATREEIIGEAFSHFPGGEIERAANTLHLGAKTMQGFAKSLDKICKITDLQEKYDLLMGYFLTKEGKPRGSLTDAKVNRTDPALKDQLEAIREEFIKAQDQLNSLKILTDTRHWLIFGIHLRDIYEKLKWSAGALDFDDLVLRTRDLFDPRPGTQTNATQWVMYKLDNGLEHILLDEAQDTSPFQWDVIERPLDEFFAGEGARDKHRSLFVVGDEKQSIYSFQGADTSLFNEKRGAIGKKMSEVSKFKESVVSTFKEVPLTLSFRSTAPVLEFVDAVFASKSVMSGLGDVHPMRHEVRRSADAGLVEIWPLVPQPEKIVPNSWEVPVDTPANVNSQDNPTVTLCNHIAKTIRNWLDKGEMLQARGRPIRAGDIIILVQKRKDLFHQMDKSLRREGVPVAGADRFKPKEDIAILDLLSYGQWALMPEDDLSLGEVLKSPLFGFTDDDLFALAHERASSLWKSLRKRHLENEKWTHAYQEMLATQKIAVHQGAYDFYTHILEARNMENGIETGRQRFFARLGFSCADSLDAFIQKALEYEALFPRNLQGFLSWFDDNAGEIKREFDQESQAVRVMTVHGAKGLEGNVVFLLDAHLPPNTKIPKSPLYHEGDDFRFPFLVGDKASQNELARKAVQEQKNLAYEEYRRIFYVAATRARDRLYICGIEPGQKGASGKADNPFNMDVWHHLAMNAKEVLKKQGKPIETIRLPWALSSEQQGWRYACDQSIEVDRKEEIAPIGQSMDDAPDWLHLSCPAEKPDEHWTPSTIANRLEEDAQMEAEVSQTITEKMSVPASTSPLKDRFARGRALHRLLEILPTYPQAEQKALGLKLLSQLMPDLESQLMGEWCDEVLAIIQGSAFAPIFSPHSRAEVSIGGTPKGAREDIMINGQIDRLAISDNEVLIVDYKTNQPPPKSEADVADDYIVQMAAYRALIQEIYPDRAVKTALLWTFEARLMVLSDKILDHAFAQYIAKP